MRAGGPCEGQGGHVRGRESGAGRVGARGGQVWELAGQSVIILLFKGS